MSLVFHAVRRSSGQVRWTRGHIQAADCVIKHPFYLSDGLISAGQSVLYHTCSHTQLVIHEINYSSVSLLHIPGERCHPCTSLFTVISAVWVRGHAEEKGKKKTEKETRGSQINSAMIKVQTLGVRWRKIQNHHISFWLCGRFRWVFTLQVHSFNIFFSFQQPLIQQIIITTPRRPDRRCINVLVTSLSGCECVGRRRGAFFRTLWIINIC